MHPALWISKTGLDAQQTNLSVIANNLANVKTTAFKRGRPVFEDLLYQTVRQPGAQSSQTTQLSSGLMMGTGVKASSTQKIHTQGNLIQTDNALDLAINGNGFFQVAMPDGTVGYSRDGQFQLDATGNMVTSSGYSLQPSITIPANTLSITIGNDGTVSAMVAGSASPTQVGQIQLAQFTNTAGLQPVGENIYIESVSSGSPNSGAPGSTGFGRLSQGSLESSNVDVVEELVNLIETQRGYEMNAKVAGAVDNELQFVSQVL